MKWDTIINFLTGMHNQSTALFGMHLAYRVVRAGCIKRDCLLTEYTFRY